MTQAFISVAYGLAPLFLLRLCDGLGSDLVWVPWVTWSVGILLAIGVLYHGVPRMMEPDPSHAFGLFLMSALLLMLITGLLRYVTISYLTKFASAPLATETLIVSKEADGVWRIAGYNIAKAPDQ